MNLPDGMTVQKLRDHPGVYVFRDLKAFSSHPRHAVAGPFTDAIGARLWILEQMESQLTDTRRPVWVEVGKALGTLSHDLGIELYLLDMVLHGKSFEQIAPYIPRGDRRLYERRSA